MKQLPSGRPPHSRGSPLGLYSGPRAVLGMSSRVPLFVRLLRLWASTLSLLGGFPYSWDGRQAGAILPALRPRGTCRLWPVLLTLLYAAAIAVPIVCFFIGFDVYEFDGSTKATLLKLYRSAEVMIFVFLHVHVLVGRHDSASLVAHFDLHFPEYTRRNWMVLTDTLRNLKGQVDGPGNVTKAESGDYKTHAITSVKPATTPRGEAGSSHVNKHGAEAALATVLRLHNSRHVQENTKVFLMDEQELSRDEVMTAYKRVYRAYECQLLMNKYFGPPALGLMSLAVLWLTVDLFYFINEELSLIALVPWTAYFLYSCMKLVVICWPAEAIKEKVQELHFAASWRRATSSDPSLQTQLTFLLELLERFPGFDVLGFFSAAKARLIGILSSIFTYIIILSQFKLSETDK
ncbi:hypothetical protein C7M84_009684 [Penaeus vannamei]|uniref:Gustatory receptor n=1 Tax=Penaeus vannamei TaxID=6689 RepID=A0A3R7PNA1_PENVA|nr:hypothetical protein C7M84_009684 [Penaeus vannamei]